MINRGVLAGAILYFVTKSCVICLCMNTEKYDYSFDYMRNQGTLEFAPQGKRAPLYNRLGSSTTCLIRRRFQV